MKKLCEYGIIEFKILLRNPMGMFFAIGFPCLLLMAYGSRTDKNEIFPLFMMLTLFSQCIVSFAQMIASNRALKSWQIYRLRGFNVSQILIVQILVHVLMACLCTIVLIIFAMIVYHIKLPVGLAGVKFIGLWLIAVVVLLLVGFVIGVAPKKPMTVSAIATPIMLGLLAVSGIFVDINAFPDVFKSIILLLPTTQINGLLLSSWSAEATPFSVNWLVIIVWIIVMCAFLIYKLKKDDLTRI